MIVIQNHDELDATKISRSLKTQATKFSNLTAIDKWSEAASCVCLCVGLYRVFICYGLVRQVSRFVNKPQSIDYMPCLIFDSDSIAFI